MDNLINQLKRLNITKLKKVDGKPLKEDLKQHARFLADCVMRRLDEVYEFYKPKIYQRTYGLYNSVYIDGVPVVKISSAGATLSIHVRFDDGVRRKGLNAEMVNLAVLLNEGWQTEGKFKNVPYFGYREATHFIEKAVEDYKRGVANPYNIKINKDYNER